MPVLSWNQLAALALRAGWSEGDASVAASITEPEAGRDSSSVQQGEPYDATGWGLWQITPGNSEPQFGIDNQLLDPWNNARAAYAKWAGAGGFSPWTTYEHGLNIPWLASAELAVAAVVNMSPAAIAALVNDARAGGGGSAGPPPQVSDWSAHVHATAAAAGRTNTRWGNGAAALAALRLRTSPPAVIIPAPGRVLPPPERI